MILLRTWTGIADHLPVRWSEWIMALPALGMAAALSYQPDMFSMSPSFARMEAWADESTWAMTVLLCGTARLLALAVNGTFLTFRYSPHLRAAASLVGGLFWSQFCLGILSAALGGQGAWSGVVAYGTLAVIELVNTYRSCVDVGAWVRERGHA